MERSIMKDLISWKDKKRRKPLVLQGARQVGKTWIMKEFGKRYFSSTAYVNLDKEPSMRASFSKDFNVKRIIEDIEIAAHIKIVPGETLIIIDEIQEEPAAITALKYFYEDAPEYPVIVAGSLLGVAIHSGASFPVGKVNLMYMHPLSFREFLMAVGEEALADYALSIDSDKNLTFRNEYISALKKYYFIGGMPEAVQAYVEENSLQEARSIQKEIITIYEDDFSKHIESKTELERTRMVWNSIPIQLAKENKKFFFGKIRKGARSADFEVSIQWLLDCGLLHKVFCVSRPGMPLKSYIEFSAYKLFSLDVGLLGAMAELDPESLLQGNRIFTEFKGAMTEQYVLQELAASGKYTPYYYSNEKSRNEIDFLIQRGSEVVPIEVKAEENLKSKSLKAFVDKFGITEAIRFSMNNHRRQDWLENIPLWNVCGI